MRPHPRGLTGLLRLALTERHAGRHADDRGSVLIEALVFMAVIAVTVAAFTLSAVGANQAQRTHHGIDIATQAAHGQIERAKTISWDQLGFRTTDPGFTAIANGEETVVLPTDPGTPDRITPTRTVTVKGLTVELRTTITWKTGTHTAGTERGTKNVTVTARWTQDGAAHEMAYTAARSSTPDDAIANTAIPVGFGDRPSPIPTPTAEPTGFTGPNDAATDTGEWD